MAHSSRPSSGATSASVRTLERRPGAAGCVLLSLSLLAGCEAPAVRWDESRPVAPTADSPIADSASALPPGPWPGEVAAQGKSCTASVRYARAARLAAGGQRWYVAWWRVRADSSAWLMSAHSDDEGSHWTGPVAVDTVDRSRLGCSRPPADVAAEARGGYVHLAYFMDAPEGAGIFFAHSMDQGATFHTPVAVVYGERPSAVSVAASGDTVAVAYLDPNALRPHVALALSYTAGHIFAQHALVVSGSGGTVAEPRVRLRGRRIEVAWLARPATSRDAGAPSITMVRHGTLQ